MNMPTPQTTPSLRYAASCRAQALPKPRTDWARAGLRYERNVVRAFSEFFTILHNPWYTYESDTGAGFISPDIIIPYCGKLVVAECKLTYKPEAIIKLRELYCPIVSLATGKFTLPLVITKNLNPASPEPALSFESAIDLTIPLLHWVGKGPILDMDKLRAKYLNVSAPDVDPLNLLPAGSTVMFAPRPLVR